MSRRKLNLPYDRSAEGRLLTVSQAADLLSCSRSWVYRLIDEGRLKAIRIGSRKGLRATEKSLEGYLASREVAARNGDSSLTQS